MGHSNHGMPPTPKVKATVPSPTKTPKPAMPMPGMPMGKGPKKPKF